MKMMKIILARIAILLSLAAVMTRAKAENDLSLELEKSLAEFIQQRQDISLCLPADARIRDVWRDMTKLMRRIGLPEQLAKTYWPFAMRRFYPCPFSPWQHDVAPVEPAELKGAWVIPPESHVLQFGRKSPMRSLADEDACDVFGYFDDREARHLHLAGAAECPFSTARDVEFLRNSPVVMRWEFVRPSRLKIDRSDISNHREEWDVLKVMRPFTFNGVRFLAGDLIAYLRIKLGGIPEESTQFRHLRKLP